MANIHDVAEAAGVSTMTVSRFFNQPDLLHSDTQETVREAVEALGYVPNHAARSLVRGHTKTVALILADITNPYFTQILRGAEVVAQDAGYTLVLCNTNEEAAKEREYIDTLVSRQVDGILLSPHDGESPAGVLRQHDTPFVLIDRKIADADVDTVTTDSFDGSRQLVEHFRKQGCCRIGFVGGAAGLSSLEERLEGYRVAMKAAGLTPEVHLGAYSIESGETIVEELIARRALPEAVIAANNFVAVGCISALRNHGLQTPGDLALACFGDLDLLARIDPFLTVIAQPAYEVGRRAMQRLIKRINGSDEPARQIKLPIELVVRKSSLSSQTTIT